MSSRQLRKLRKQQELLSSRNDSANGDEDASDDDDEPGPGPVRSKPQFSGFAALAGDDDEDKTDEEPEAEPKPQAQEEDDDDAGLADEPAEEQPAVVKKSKKNKKKKKKAKKAETPAEPEKATGGDDGLDDIDRAIKELNLAPTRELGSSTAESDVLVKASARLSQLLRINFQHLKVLNEMRRLFGKEAIESAAAEEEGQITENAREFQRRGGREGVDLETYLRVVPGLQGGLSEVVARRNPFIEGKKRWPRGSAGGLTMTTIGRVEGDMTEFSFAHDKTYGDLDSSFFFLIGMHDPTRLIVFLHEHPYHVSTLIQVSKVAIQDQNASLAAELCERALFTFGRVTLSTFRKKLEEGQARLSFSRPENRQFWLAGYNYIKNLIRKGTFRTALEWTKIFISIAPEDPYAMINWLHALAVRAHEAQWFADLCDSELLSGTSPKIDTAVYVRQSLVLSKLQLGDRTSARTLLAEGMGRLPWLYSTLFKALNLDVPKSLWGILPRDEDEELHTELYIHVAKDLWNKPETTALLVEVAKAISRPDTDALPLGPRVSLGTARFVYLDNTPSLMTHVPRNMLHVAPNFDFDPLPPPKEENIFSHERQRMPWDSDPAQDARELPDLFPDGADLGEDQGGYLQRAVDMFRAMGALVPRPGEMPGGMAGEWGEDEDDSDGREYDSAGEFQDHGDYPEDEDASEDEMPPLEPFDGSQRTPGAWPEE